MRISVTFVDLSLVLVILFMLQFSPAATTTHAEPIEIQSVISHGRLSVVAFGQRAIQVGEVFSFASCVDTTATPIFADIISVENLTAAQSPPSTASEIDEGLYLSLDRKLSGTTTSIVVDRHRNSEPIRFLFQLTPAAALELRGRGIPPFAPPVTPASFESARINATSTEGDDEIIVRMLQNRDGIVEVALSAMRPSSVPPSTYSLPYDHADYVTFELADCGGVFMVLTTLRPQ